MFLHIIIITYHVNFHIPHIHAYVKYKILKLRKYKFNIHTYVYVLCIYYVCIYVCMSKCLIHVL